MSISLNPKIISKQSTAQINQEQKRLEKVIQPQFFERIAYRNPIPPGVGQGKLYDNAVSGGRISSFQGGDPQNRDCQKDCPFCQSSVLNYQKFYEDALIIALYTHKPIMPGHCLIIPKRHIERFEMLSDHEAVQICRVIRKVDQAVKKVFGTSSYLIWQKNGREVGQSVPHVHFHYIPRLKGDGSTLKFLFNMFWINAQQPIRPSQMHQTVEKLKAAIFSTQSTESGTVYSASLSG